MEKFSLPHIVIMVKFQ